MKIIKKDNIKKVAEAIDDGAVLVQFDLITKRNINKTRNMKYNDRTKVIAVVSGKGGVGKSTTSALIALKLASIGYSVGLLDVDITAPNLLFMFRSTQQMKPDNLIEPVKIRDNLKLASVAALTSRFDKPILLVGKTKVEIIHQFVNTVNWGKLDYLVIDTPPGTSDEILTIFSLFKDASYIVVTTPKLTDLQDALRMKNLLNLYNFNIYGMVVNSAYLECPKCGEKIYLGNIDDVKALGIRVLFELPYDIDSNGDVNKIFEKYGDLIDEEVLP